MKQVLLIPGMDDKVRPLERLTKNWPRRFNLQPNFFVFGWEDPTAEYEQKQAAILAQVERLAKLGSLSIVGVSAGGHKAVDLLAERPDIVKSAVNVCGLSRLEGWSGGSARHALLRRSLEVFNDQSFDSERVMTFRPLYDELVPGETVPIAGARNIRLHTVEHIASIAWTLAAHAGQIAEFINEQEQRVK